MLLISEIERCIFLVRGKKVMLDSDLARLYGVTTFNLNKAVKRNLGRFPSDFMFQLTNQEVSALIFQNGISKPIGRGGRRSAPLAFTQEGIAMLSSILRSDEAMQVNILIMRAFVSLREMVADHTDLVRRIELLELRYDAQFKSIFDAIRDLMSDHALPRSRVKGLEE